MTVYKNHTAPTWANQLWHARQLPTADLRRHAAISQGNRHRCMNCFCCAAWAVLSERGEDTTPTGRERGDDDGVEYADPRDADEGGLSIEDRAWEGRDR